MSSGKGFLKAIGAQQHRGARFLLVSASLVIVIAGLRELKPIALPLLIAIFLSVLSSPILSWLSQRGVPRLFGVIAAVLTNLLVLLLMVVMVGGSLRAFTASLPEYQARFEERALAALVWLDDVGVDTAELQALLGRAEGPEDAPRVLVWLFDRDGLDISTLDTLLGDEAAEELSSLAFRQVALGNNAGNTSSFIGFDAFLGFVGSTLWSIATLLTTGLLVILMMVFLLFEAAKMPRKLEVALGWNLEDMERLTKARKEVQRYLVYKTLISLGTGVLAGLWVWALGINFPVLWGLIAFLLNYIPSLGSIIASVPPMLLAWIDVSIGAALLVGLGYLVINLTLGNFLEPHLMGRRLGISTLVVFLSLVFWGWMWGPVGMLLSVPLTMILRIALENTEDLSWVAQLIAANVRSPEPPPAEA